MAERATISLDEESHSFLTEIADGNKSAYINELLKREKKRLLEEAILKANQEESEDIDYQKEIASWDATLNDGLE
ncbi:MAG: CopG family transcriptional regulator [Bacteroidota bacterium]